MSVFSYSSGVCCFLSPLKGFLILLRFATLEGNRLLQLDPAIDGVFKGPYPIGIDPVNVCLYYGYC